MRDICGPPCPLRLPVPGRSAARAQPRGVRDSRRPGRTGRTSPIRGRSGCRAGSEVRARSQPVRPTRTSGCPARPRPAPGRRRGLRWSSWSRPGPELPEGAVELVLERLERRDVRGRHPRLPTTAANRCWCPSTCSPRRGSRGTHKGTCPASRASMMVPGPPWQTTTGRLREQRDEAARGRGTRAPRPRAARRVTTRAGRRTARRRRRTAAASTHCDHAVERVVVGARQGQHERPSQEGPHEVCVGVELQLALPLDDPARGERSAEPPGHRRACRPGRRPR